MKKLCKLIPIMALCSSAAYGMSVDKMVLFSSGDGDYFQVTNTTDSPLFITSSISERKVIEDGGTENIEYTADNIQDWKINASPTRFVLYPNEKKIVYVNENICTDEAACFRETDTIFSVSFVPSIYVPKGEKAVSNVGILFGFAPAFVLPAHEPKYDYSFSVEDNKEGYDYLNFKNKGNTMLTVMFDQCSQRVNQEETCTGYKKVFHTRDAKLQLPYEYKKGKLKIKVLNGNETYVEDYVR